MAGRSGTAALADRALSPYDRPQLIGSRTERAWAVGAGESNTETIEDIKVGMTKAGSPRTRRM